MKHKERNKAVPAVYLLLRRGEKYVLLLRKCDHNQNGEWNLCSGEIQQGELPATAMIREAKEELLITLTHLKVVHTMYRTKHDESGDRLDFFFEARGWRGDVRNGEPHKCEQFGWFTPEDFPKETPPHVPYAVKSIASGYSFSELGPEWLKKKGVWMLG